MSATKRPKRATADRQDPVEYFDWQRESSIADFWRRFGTVPDFACKRVLEVGCGHGALAVDLAERGASLVVGSDLDEGRVQAARQIADSRFPDLADRLKFTTADVTHEMLDEAPFDVAVSKDTFEHIEDLDGMLAGVHRQLAPGGVFYVGLSPLYFSPLGDHGRSGLKVPWAHAVAPRRLVLRSMSSVSGRQVTRLMDVGLNGLEPYHFRDAFESSSFAVERMDYNRGDRRLMPLLSRLRQFRPLEKYATVSIYAALRA